MANHGANGSSQPLIPFFKGEKYHLWSLKMKTMFKSQELWDIVENGYVEPDPAPAVPDASLKESRKKDAKALFFIQTALDDDIFPRITDATTAHEAWEILKQEYLGDQRVINVRLQTLRSDFAALTMGDKETVQSYLSKVTEIVGQMRSYGEKIDNETIVSKVLRSLNGDWSHIVPAIEESKDLSTYSFDALMGSLLAHESRMKQGVIKMEEKAFQVNEDSSYKGQTNNYGNQGRGRGGFRGGHSRGRGGRGRGQYGYDGGRGRGQYNYDGGKGIGHTSNSDSGRQNKRKNQCHYCNRFGHKEVDCWDKQKAETNQAKFSEQIEEDESRLFMAYSKIQSSLDSDDIWFLDSGCSNHMSGTKSLFKTLDESKKGDVRLGDNKKMHVEGNGNIVIQTLEDGAKILSNVQFVPGLAHNLLSIGQLMNNGYKIIFDDDMCAVIDKKSGQSIAKVVVKKAKLGGDDKKKASEEPIVRDRVPFPHRLMMLKRKSKLDAKNVEPQFPEDDDKVIVEEVSPNAKESDAVSKMVSAPKEKEKDVENAPPKEIVQIPFPHRLAKHKEEGENEERRNWSAFDSQPHAKTPFGDVVFEKRENNSSS
ncbi:uncharacterized protein LOC141588518 [Silene latifolia]|uniref:uncharacterized protein LOC141588518 n=1 Tax=Silene latifolia TaxID=37657 RepID=UPI003D785296